MNLFNKQNQKAFTLIELLVVISIIGFLSAIVLASLKTARERAQDVATVEAAKQLINAVELYRADNNGKYPYEDFFIANPQYPDNGTLDSGFIYTPGSGGYIQGYQYSPAVNIFQLLRNYIKTNYDATPLELNSFPGAINSQGSKMFSYSLNTGQTLPTASGQYRNRCSDRSEIPKYLITFGVNDPNYLNLPTWTSVSKSGGSGNERYGKVQKAICVY